MWGLKRFSEELLFQNIFSTIKHCFLSFTKHVRCIKTREMLSLQPVRLQPFTTRSKRHRFDIVVISCQRTDCKHSISQIKKELKSSGRTFYLGWAVLRISTSLCI